MKIIANLQSSLGKEPAKVWRDTSKCISSGSFEYHIYYNGSTKITPYKGHNSRVHGSGAGYPTSKSVYYYVNTDQATVDC